MQSQLHYQAIQLDARKSLPLYLQLTEELCRLIEALAPRATERMLSERKLAELLSIDRSTVKKAYQELKKEGVLISETPRTFSIRVTERKRCLRSVPNIGIILPMLYSQFVDINHGLPHHFLKGILDNASQRNIATSMLRLPPPEASREQIRSFLDYVSQHLIGVIHFGGRGCYPDNPLASLLQCQHLPQVFISATPKYRHIGVVSSDLSSGGNALAEQLWELGHKHVGVIYKQTSPYDRANDGYFVFDAMSRVERMLQIFRSYDLDCDNNYHCRGCVSYSKTLEALRAKKEAHHLPTVFWCVNDELAHWTIQALGELGLTVPDDISVVGFDGLKVYQEDALTTINLPFYAIGQRALDLLLELYDHHGHAESMRIDLKTSLVIRKSLSYAKQPENLVM